MSAKRALSRGDFVLVAFPFTDLTSSKVRPALIVGRPAGDDVIVAFVTSRGEGADPDSEHLLLPTDPEFPQTGLKGPSRLRLNKLATLHHDIVRRRLGRMGRQTAASVALALRHVFEL